MPRDFISYMVLKLKGHEDNAQCFYGFKGEGSRGVGCWQPPAPKSPQLHVCPARGPLHNWNLSRCFWPPLASRIFLTAHLQYGICAEEPQPVLLCASSPYPTTPAGGSDQHRHPDLDNTSLGSHVLERRQAPKTATQFKVMGAGIPGVMLGYFHNHMKSIRACWKQLDVFLSRFELILSMAW